MRGLIAEDQVQLARIERTIAEIGSKPAAEQSRMRLLLVALEKERAHILHCSRRTPPQVRIIRRPPPARHAAL